MSAVASFARRAWTSAAAALLVACTPGGPREIAYGEEACGYCRMSITDRRFGAQALTATGRVQTFDSIECLAGYVLGVDAAQLRGAWVTDFHRPGTFVAADSATYWQVDGASPMGRGLVATTGDRRPAGAAGAPLAWASVVALVGREAVRPGSAHAH